MKNNEKGACTRTCFRKLILSLYKGIPPFLELSLFSLLLCALYSIIYESAARELKWAHSPTAAASNVKLPNSRRFLSESNGNINFSLYPSRPPNGSTMK